MSDRLLRAIVSRLSPKNRTGFLAEIERRKERDSDLLDVGTGHYEGPISRAASLPYEGEIRLVSRPRLGRTVFEPKGPDLPGWCRHCDFHRSVHRFDVKAGEPEYCPVKP